MREFKHCCVRRLRYIGNKSGMIDNLNQIKKEEVTDEKL